MVSKTSTIYFNICFVFQMSNLLHIISQVWRTSRPLWTIAQFEWLLGFDTYCLQSFPLTRLLMARGCLLKSLTYTLKRDHFGHGFSFILIWPIKYTSLIYTVTYMTIGTSSFNVFIEEEMLQISHIDDHRRDQSFSPLTWESHQAHTIPITCCFIKIVSMI